MADIELKQVTDAVAGINKAFEEFKASNDENSKKHDAVIEAKLQKLEAEIERNQKIADEAVLAAKRASRAGGDDKAAAELDAKALEWANIPARRRGSVVSQFGADDLKSYSRALDTFLRKDTFALSADEQKALSVGSDPDGGYLVTPDTTGRIVQKTFDTSPMRAYASVQVISTDALEGLFDLNEASASWVSETGTRSVTNTPQLGKWRIPVWEIQASPTATQQLLDDASINVENWLAMKVADKFARAEATAFVTGTGVGAPRGFLTYNDGSTIPGTIKRVKTGVDGDFAGAGAGANTLITALYDLKAVYKANAAWFMNRGTVSRIRRLVDSDGAYVWTPGIAAGQPATLLGYPVAPAFEDMPDIATDSLSIAVGDMRAAYQIVDRQGIRVLRDPYTAKPYVVFYTTKRVGGDVIDFEALRIVQFGD